MDDLTAAIAEAARRVAPTKAIFDLSEVAEMTGGNTDAIRRKCKDGTYRHTRIGKHYGMTLPQIVALVASHEVQCAAGSDASSRHASGTSTGGVEAVLAAGAAKFKQRQVAA